MKLPLLLFAVAIATGCTMEKQVQVRIVNVELVKVEKVHRSPSVEENLFTWRDDDHVQYISFEPVSNHINIGSRMKMMIRR